MASGSAVSQLLRLALRARSCPSSCLGKDVVSHRPRSNQSRRTSASAWSVMGPIHRGGPVGTRSFVQGCSIAMTPHSARRDAQVSGPSMQAAETSIACGQRRMTGRSSSTTDRSSSTAQAVQTTTVNGRSVPRGEEVNAPCSAAARRDQSRVVSSVCPFCERVSTVRRFVPGRAVAPFRAHS